MNVSVMWNQVRGTGFLEINIFHGIFTRLASANCHHLHTKYIEESQHSYYTYFDNINFSWEDLNKHFLDWIFIVRSCSLRRCSSSHTHTHMKLIHFSISFIISHHIIFQCMYSNFCNINTKKETELHLSSSSIKCNLIKYWFLYQQFFLLWL